MGFRGGLDAVELKNSCPVGSRNFSILWTAGRGIGLSISTVRLYLWGSGRNGFKLENMHSTLKRIRNYRSSFFT